MSHFRFRLLVAQLEKARRLMNERVLFLKMLIEFRKTIGQCVELSERARQLPLSSLQTSDELQNIVRSQSSYHRGLLKAFQSNDLSDLQSRARQESDRVSEQQRRAEMTVTDFEHSVQQLNEATRSPSALIGYGDDKVSVKTRAKIKPEMILNGYLVNPKRGCPCSVKPSLINCPCSKKGNTCMQSLTGACIFRVDLSLIAETKTYARSSFSHSTHLLIATLSD